MFRLGLLFITTTCLELFILFKVNQYMGIVPTISLILFTGFFGAFLARQQGWAVVGEISNKLQQGQLPAGELLDGVCILIASAFMVTPGLLTDIAGFALLTPLVRSWIKSWLVHRMEDWVANQTVTVISSEMGTMDPFMDGGFPPPYDGDFAPHHDGFSPPHQPPTQSDVIDV
jgi:UPF0716 protein FxsA